MKTDPAHSHFILASASPRRIELLRLFQVDFQIRPSHAGELHDDRLTAAELCTGNALRKAAEVAQKQPDAIVLGADTLVSLEGALFGKPRDLVEAARMLSTLSGRTHQVVTGVALLHIATGRQEVFAVETQVTFKKLDLSQVRAYLEVVPVLDKAGSYAIQDHGEMLVENVVGSRTNVVGLPVERLAEALCGWNLITPLERDRIAGSPR